MRIAVDAMGGDLAPVSVVEGAVSAAKQFDVEIVLVGQKDLVDLELAKFAPLPRGLTVEHAPEVVGMDEPAITPVRKKKDSSIAKAVQLLKERNVDELSQAIEYLVENKNLWKTIASENYQNLKSKFTNENVRILANYLNDL